MPVSVADVVEQDPKRLADALVEASRERPDWLAAFTAELESRAMGDQLRRVLRVWGLSAAETGRLFGVSRQAVAKWLAQGLPADRVEAVADLAAATDLLVHYLKADRIPATVRRPAERLGGGSLLDLVAAGRTRQVLAAVRAMFDVAAIQS